MEQTYENFVKYLNECNFWELPETKELENAFETREKFMKRMWICTGNVEDGIKASHNTLKFRKEKGCETILDTFKNTIGKMKAYFPLETIDNKKNIPTLWVPWGKIDIYSCKKHFTFEDIDNAIIYILEETLTFQKGKEQWGMNVVIDCENLSVKNFHPDIIKIVKKLMHYTHETYPNNLVKLYFINTPLIFKQMYKIIEPHLSEKVKQKTIFSKNGEKPPI